MHNLRNLRPKNSFTSCAETESGKLPTKRTRGTFCRYQQKPMVEQTLKHNRTNNTACGAKNTETTQVQSSNKLQNNSTQLRGEWARRQVARLQTITEAVMRKETKPEKCKKRDASHRHGMHFDAFVTIYILLHTHVPTPAHVCSYERRLQYV